VSKIGLDWLRDYVEFDLDAAELAEAISVTLTEAEVAASPVTGLRDVVVAKVVTVEPHPDAERLSTCVVDWGAGSGTVVCGAPNVRANMTSALALPGAVIADNRRIEEATIRGRRSHGMLVSAAELGIEGEADGILELEDGLQPGTDVREVLAAGDVIDVDVQANRADCMGVIGIAREVAAMLGKELRRPAVTLEESDVPAGELASVEIEDAADCPRYIARVIQDVRVGPSPPWIAARLRSAGLRPKSNIVDITNFVMLEYGHPVHAFDYDRLRERRIAVRRARDGERLETLDGVDRKLSPGNLLICDGDAPIAIAGIIGGAATEVGESTKTVLIECASFDPTVVRRGSKALGVRTDASQRFERGTDLEVMDEVAARVSALLAEHAGGRVARGVAEAGGPPPERRVVGLDLKRIARTVAPGIDASVVRRGLEPLGFEVLAVEGDASRLAVRVPPFRPDVELEADVVEEIARTYGYDRVEPSLPFRSPEAPPPEASGGGAESRCREAMVGLGFVEAVTTAFMSRETLAWLEAPAGGEGPVVLTNPVNKEMPLLRTSLLPGLLDAARRNRNVGTEDLRLFEVGKTYRTKGDTVVETWRLAGVMAGSAGRPGWARPRREIDFYDGKGVLWALAESLKVDSLRARWYDGGVLAEGSSAILIVDGAEAGSFGMLDGPGLERWGLEGPVFAFGLDCDAVAGRRGVVGDFEELPRYPSVRRDAALVVDRAVAAGEIRDAIVGAGEPLLADVGVFDVYEGPQVPEGKRSVGFSLTYASLERTLTDDEVDAAHGRIVDRITETFHAALRE